MKMIGTVFYIVVIVCLQYTSGATSNQLQEISMGGRVVSLNYSMLSPSCANETLHLVNDTYALVQTSYNCSAKNETYGVCLLDVYPEEYEAKCTKAGGQFYMNQTNDEFHKCFIVADDFSGTVDVGILNYPICAGASCNVSEVETAFYEALLADAWYGPISNSLSSACSIFNPLMKTSVSGAYNRFNDRVTSIIQIITFAILLKNI